MQILLVIDLNFDSENDSYLCEEWKARHKETSEDLSSKFLNLRFVSLEVLQISGALEFIVSF